jgi:hypothetical protein
MVGEIGATLGRCKSGSSGWRSMAEPENAEVVVRKQPGRSGVVHPDFVRHRRFDRVREDAAIPPEGL